MGGWAELPSDLINSISQRLQTYVDYVRFSAVCVRWNSAIPKRPTFHQFHQIPWLMLPFDNKNKTSHSFYSIPDDKVYHLDLPEIMGKEFRGSSYGWVVTVENDPELYLFNPLSNVRIALPPLYTFPNIMGYFANKTNEEYSIIDKEGDILSWSHAELQDMFIKKLILSSPPHGDYLAIAIYGEYSKLAFCRSNDEKWTAFKTSFFCFADVIFHEDKIYALCMDGELLVSDKYSLPKLTRIRAKLPVPILYHSRLYLVGSNNGLMMVARFRHNKTITIVDDPSCSKRCTYKTEGFKIYMIKPYSRKRRLRWTKIATLGDNAMFLGYNASILVSSLNFPTLKGNCIYFTDDEMEKHDANKYGGFDIGVFDLEGGCVEEFKKLNLNNQLVWPPPVWVMPNP